jgi:DNA-directed RNA polymerase subunit N (RpoN/RPB10)
MIPLLCFTCGAKLKWDEFYQKIDIKLKKAFDNGEDIKDIDIYVNIEKAILDEFGITRMCCRRMYHGDQRILGEIDKLYLKK